MSANDYLNGEVCYGGIMTPRWKVFDDLRSLAAGITPDKHRQERIVNAYLAGHSEF